MKITKSQLKKIIKEELDSMMQETESGGGEMTEFMQALETQLKRQQDQYEKVEQDMKKFEVEGDYESKEYEALDRELSILGHRNSALKRWLNAEKEVDKILQRGAISSDRLAR